VNGGGGAGISTSSCRDILDAMNDARDLAGTDKKKDIPGKIGALGLKYLGKFGLDNCVMQAAFAAASDGVGAIGSSGVLKWTNGVASAAQFGLRMGNCINKVVFPDNQGMVNDWIDALDCVKGTDLKAVFFAGTTCALQKVLCTPVITSCDPNEIIGPDGYRPKGYVAATPPMPYKVLFENDPEVATTSAQRVSIRVPLDANVNPLSVQLGAVGFQRLTLPVPAGLAAYNTIYHVADSVGVDVEMTAGVDVNAREVFWEFQALDRVTGQAPADPQAGFLPPNDSLASGEGFVNYTVRPRRGVVTGDSIRAAARIVFDFNDVIPTNRELNIVDAVAPVSFVQTIPPSSTNEYLLRVSITDDPGGSGPKFFEIFVSEDNGLTYRALQGAAAGDTVAFTAQAGRAYLFYSIATDNVGNVEGAKSTHEAVISPCPIPTNVAATNLTTTTARVSFVAAGGAVTGGYLATATPAVGPVRTATGPTSPLELTGLEPGTAYALTLTSQCATLATNAPAVTFTTLGMPLPVELVAFTAAAKGASVQLSWRTASEKNSARFEVERSTDGVRFWYLGERPGQGTKASPTDYAFLDTQVPKAPGSQDLIYYRLRQVDHDGRATYSPVRSVRFASLPLGTLTVYPNPAHSSLTATGLTAGALVEVFDALGRRVATATANADGIAPLTLPAGLAAGMYLVRGDGHTCRLAVE
jgi:hypothetical protein